MYNVLFHLDPKKASGPDNISIRLLKECATSITTSLTCLFNKSLQRGTLPSEWKLSNVIPIHKKGDNSFVENYRPISLLCVIAKVMERCIYNHLVDSEDDILCTAWFPERKTLYRPAPFRSSPYQSKSGFRKTNWYPILRYCESVWCCGS